MNRTVPTTSAAERSSKPAFPHVLIRASAGSGKTFQLSNRYLGLLVAGVGPEQILATTFTRKAAGEILDRILFRLARAATNEAQRSQLGKAIGDESLSRGKCLDLLHATTRNLHSLRVGTLDSFFAKVAGSYSLEFGLPIGWRIVDVQTDAALRDEAIEAMLNKESVSDLLTLMHLLTKGETARGVSELVRGTVAPLYELYRETTSDAWQKLPHSKPLKEDELESAIEDLRTLELPNDRRFSDAHDKDFQNALQRDWETFIAKGLASKVLQREHEYYRKPIPEQAIQIYKKLLEHARAVVVGQLARQTEATFKLLERFDVEYRRLKQERRAMRFDDVTRCLAKAAHRSDPRQMAFRLGGDISYLLLDEFQDTSLAQWQALKPFAQSVTTNNKTTSLFCVGDVKQAIYGWRGGVAEIFDELQRQLPDLVQQGLNQSFRSAPPVIEAVNQVFGGLSTHPNLSQLADPLKDWCDKFSEQSTAKSELPGYVCLEAAPQAEAGKKPLDAVLQYTADKIADLVRDAPQQTVGVLVRRNETVGKLIYLLRKRGVDASEEGGNPLTDSAAVELILSLLRLADHPGDTVARYHLATSPLADSIDLDDYTDDDAAETLAREMRRSLIQQGYGPTVYRAARQLAPNCNSHDLNRLQQLVELAYQYQERATLRSDDFVAFVTNERISDPTSASLRVMTVHQAKGLEFDTVLLPELDVRLVGQRGWFVAGRSDPTQPVECVCRNTNAQVRKMLPASIQKMFDDDQRQSVAEALCVLYVSLTRPIHALHMIVAPTKDNERTLPKTFAGLLRAALTDRRPLAEATVAYERGDRDWYQHLGRHVSPASPAADRLAGQTKPPTIRFAEPEETRRRGLERISPSGLEGGSHVRLDQLLHTSGQSDSLLRGTIIHAWLEQIEWLDDGRPDESRLRQVAEEFLRAEQPDHHIDVDLQLSQFRALLAAPSVARVLSRSAYQPPEDLGFDSDVHSQLASAPLRLQVQNERRFAVRREDKLLSGSIDRLVLMHHGDDLVAADILDFKTDALPPDDAEALAEKISFYRPQLAAYRQAVAKMTGLAERSVSARLAFLEGGVIRPI